MDVAEPHHAVRARLSDIESYKEYIYLVAKNPITFAGGYVRRIFNGLDVQYASPYIRHLRGDRSQVRSWLLYTLLFIAAMSLVSDRLRLRLGRVDVALLGVLLVACLTAVPGSIEPRYLLPAQVVVYSLACFMPNARLAWRGLLRERWVVVVPLYLLFVLTCFALADDTYSLLQYGY